jgi:hypothetical protein
MKTRPADQLVGPASLTSGQFGLRLFATSSPCVVESKTLVQFDIWVLTHMSVFSTYDILTMITQQNLWNSLEINTYLLSHV